MSSGSQSFYSNTRIGANSQAGERSSANATNYSPHPFLKMPGQTQAQSGQASRADTDMAEVRDLPVRSRQSQQHPRTRTPVASGERPLPPPVMSQEEWDEAADKIDGLVDDDALKFALDCFINLQQAMEEMREAVGRTRYRRALAAGERAATEGLDRLNGDLHQVFVTVLERDERRDERSRGSGR